MFDSDSPGDEYFRQHGASQAELQAMRDLAERQGRTLAEMEAFTMNEACEQAQAVYGEQLPEFWRVWLQWQQPYDVPPMGEL